MSELPPTVNFIRSTVEPIAHKYTIRLDRDITDPEFFEEELYTIRQASENDIVHILINSGGGRLDTAKAFLTSLAQSPAHIITEIEGEACSAATLIFLAGHEYRVSDDATMMLHTSSYMYGGKESNVRQYVNHQAKANDRLLRKYYKHFLTEEEIAQVIEGADFWMDCDEILERLEKRQELYEKEFREDNPELFESLLEDIMEDVPPREELEAWNKEDLIKFILGEDISDETKPILKQWVSEDAVYNLTLFKDGTLNDGSGEEGFSKFVEVYEEMGGEDLKTYAAMLEVKHPHNISYSKLAQRLDEKIKEIIDSMNN